VEWEGLKRELSAHLKEICFFLEYQEANPFRIRAFQAAPKAFSALSDEELKGRIEAATLIELKGIGKGIAAIAEEFLKKKTSQEWREAKGKLPVTLLELSDLKGVGASKIKVMFEKLGIKSLGELEYACNENRLIKLSGFGAKTQERVLKEIQLLKNRRGKYLLHDALEQAEHLENKFPKKLSFIRVGDLGTKREIVESFDYLVPTSSAQKTGDEMAAWPMLQKMDSNKKSDFLEATLKGNRKIRVRFVPPQSTALSSIFYTSSPLHWSALEKAALQQGFELTPTEIKQKGKSFSIVKEEALYEALGFGFCTPEMREFKPHRQEKEFCTLEDITGVFHAHTTYSDGRNTLGEMVEAAQTHSWSYLGLSDHSKTAFYAQGLKEGDLKRQWKEIDGLNKKLKDFTILKGIESDILKDGKLDYSSSVLKRFDFVIASIHSRFGMTDMTKRLIKAIEDPFTTMVGHLSGRLLLARPAYEFNVDKIIDAAIRNKKIIELNANPHRLDIDWRHLAKACDKGLLISINPDAHSVKGYDHVKYGVWMARKAGVLKDQIFNTWSLKAIQTYLNE